MIFELAGTVAVLALFGIASPDLYRTTLWQVGSDNGFNSSPLQILYAYANYRPIPKTPFVWSARMTEFNLVMSVLSTFILLVKVVMFTLHIWYPLLGVATNAALTALWATSIWGQAGPDYSDPAHPSSIPWYITKSCSYAEPLGAVGGCKQAKASFAMSIVMCAIFFLNMILGIWSLIPSKAMREASKMEVDDLQAETKGSPASENSAHGIWQMKSVRATVTPVPQQPFTPRTLAFNTLDRQLPLRQQQPSTRFA